MQIQVPSDLIIRKTENGVFEARLVNPTNHLETYCKGSWGMTEADAIRNLTSQHNVKLPAGFKIH